MSTTSDANCVWRHLYFCLHPVLINEPCPPVKFPNRLFPSWNSHSIIEIIKSNRWPEKKGGYENAVFQIRWSYGDRAIFYEEYGTGEPLVFLHGNTASSKMFELLMPLYAENFRCILIDFLGNGQSDRVEHFSSDIWYDEALQAIALAEHLQCGKDRKSVV